ncbi:hypothetical protein B0H10DRAFT_1941462 [Mycena sp. CBHHK59/15]|nr:hypothetical protein B0H10DRAFT_1941462 [Mycena sp. CBHHK59/15]
MLKCNHAKSSKFSVYLTAIDGREVLIRPNLTSTSKATEARWARAVQRTHCPQDESSCALLYDEHISYVSSFTLRHVYARSTRSVSIPTRALLSAPPLDTSLTRTIPAACHSHATPARRHEQDQSQSALHTPHPLPSDRPSGCWPTPALLGPPPPSTSSAHHTLVLTAPKSTAKSAAESTQSQESMSADKWATAVGLPPVAKGQVSIGDCERENAPGVLAAGDDCVAQPWTS